MEMWGKFVDKSEVLEQKAPLKKSMGNRFCMCAT